MAVTAVVLGAPAWTRANDQWGGQSRADAASQMIVLGVQQGIDALPPSSGQSFTYAFNAEAGTFEPTEQLGPTVLRVPQTIGVNRLSLRVAASYFAFDQTFGPIIYRLNVPQDAGPNYFPVTYGELGTAVNADVTALGFALTYGITERLEATMNIPVTVVYAQAKQIATVDPADPARQFATIPLFPGETPSRALPDGLAFSRIGFKALGFDFNQGTHVGLGRISVGVKDRLAANDWGAVAAAADFYCNSPSQAEFAGSNSASILPRVIGELYVAKHLNAYADLGVEYDFQVDELSRLAWDIGVSMPIAGASIDVGIGGSKFQQGITWTPKTTSGVGQASATYPAGVPGVLTAFDPAETELGTNYVNALVGIKLKLVEHTVASGAVSVPVTNEGFQPAALGTLAVEYYF